MAASLEKQRQSVQKQAAAVSGYTVGTPPVTPFFTVPWPSPVALASPVAGATCEPMPQQDLNSLVEEAAQKESVKAEVVHAVIKEESAGRPCAVSVKGAQGLMQIMPETAQQFGVSDPFDPKQNVDAGTKLLKALLTKYNGDISLALSAYNAGSARVDHDKGIPQIPDDERCLRYHVGSLHLKGSSPGPRVLSWNLQELRVLNQQIVECELCPRLVDHRTRMAQVKRRAYRDWDYWGRPVPSSVTLLRRYSSLDSRPPPMEPIALDACSPAIALVTFSTARFTRRGSPLSPPARTSRMACR